MKDLIKDIFTYLEIDKGMFVAGMIGASVSLTSRKNTSIMQAIILVIVGAVVAGYTTPLLEIWFPNQKMMNAMAFVIGLTSMRLVEGVLKLADKFKMNPLIFINVVKDYFQKK